MRGCFVFFSASSAVALLACAEADGDMEMSTAVPSTEPVFVERASEAGLDFVHQSGATGEYNYPELLVGGGALLDVDDDGLLDVYLVQSGPVPGGPEAAASAGPAANRPGNRLYRNLGDGGFEDVTDAAGVGDTGYGAGATATDVDRDGLVDLYVTNVGPNRLYRNLGHGVFEDVTERAGVDDRAWSSSSVFFDYDGDLDLDLFVANYVVWSAGRERPCLGPNGLRNYCNPAEYPPAPDSLYRNDGGGRFTDVSEVAGIRSVAGPGLGVVAADFDGDDLVDLYVANDQAANHLWLNRGRRYVPRGRAGAGRGTQRTRPARGRHGHCRRRPRRRRRSRPVPDSPERRDEHFLPQRRRWLLSRRDRRGKARRREQAVHRLRHLLVRLRRRRRSRPVRRQRQGDAGDTAAFDYREPNQLLRGMPSGRYEDVSSRAGPALELLEVSRGAAFGDLDNDGDVDVLLVNNEGPVRLFRNDVGNARSWLVVDLCGGGVFDRSAIGARVTVEAAGRSWTREVRAAYSFAVGNDPRVHFGLGDAEQVDRLEVRWPDGTVTDRTNVEVNRILRLLAPGGERPAEGVCRDAE